MTRYTFCCEGFQLCLFPGMVPTIYSEIVIDESGPGTNSYKMHAVNVYCSVVIYIC